MRRIDKVRVAEKALRAVMARTNTGRANYAVDLIADEIIGNWVLDEALHAVVEIGFGKGPVDRRVVTWLRKMAKHRRIPRRKARRTSKKTSHSRQTKGKGEESR